MRVIAGRQQFKKVWALKQQRQQQQQKGGARVHGAPFLKG
jgi:hypothetical protein